jgi:glycosyltransferase involved in cell wall biosynthesis
VIDSYLCQKHLGKIIFVDDCSSDNTTEYVAELSQQYPDKIHYQRMSEKSTLPNIRNIGVSLATSEYIFMGEDDVLLPEDHFEILLEQLKSRKADIIGGRRIYMWADQTFESAKAFADLDTEPVFVRVPFEAYFERPIEHAQQVNRLHSNVLMKRSIFEHVQYDPLYGGNAFREETDFFLRVYDAGYSLWFIPDTLSYHLKNTDVNQTGGSRKKPWVYEWQVWKNTWRLFMKNKDIFTKKLGVRNIYGYAVLCLMARYWYFIKRRLDQKIHRKSHAKT